MWQNLCNWMQPIKAALLFCMQSFQAVSGASQVVCCSVCLHNTMKYWIFSVVVKQEKNKGEMHICTLTKLQWSRVYLLKIPFVFCMVMLWQRLDGICAVYFVRAAMIKICNLVLWLSGSCLFYKEDQSLFCFLVLFISFHLITVTACYPGLSESRLS